MTRVHINSMRHFEIHPLWVMSYELFYVPLCVQRSAHKKARKSNTYSDTSIHLDSSPAGKLYYFFIPLSIL
jgi:hypothetical protein